MKFRNGMEAHRTVRDSWGARGYLFWCEDSYFPEVIYVRGDNISDAEEWFVCDEHAIRFRLVDDADMTAEFSTPEAIERAMDDGIVSYNDSGQLYWSEEIGAVQVHGPEEY